MPRREVSWVCDVCGNARESKERAVECARDDLVVRERLSLRNEVFQLLDDAEWKLSTSEMRSLRDYLKGLMAQPTKVPE